MIFKNSLLLSKGCASFSYLTVYFFVHRVFNAGWWSVPHCSITYLNMGNWSNEATSGEAHQLLFWQSNACAAFWQISPALLHNEPKGQNHQHTWVPKSPDEMSYFVLGVSLSWKGCHLSSTWSLWCIVVTLPKHLTKDNVFRWRGKQIQS